jgi:Trypsin-like peptidase domain
MSDKSFPLWATPLRFTAFALVALLSPLAPYAQQAGGVAPASPQVRLIRSVIGAKGEQRNGTFVMTEPRSIFYVPEDREVIVYFEWEGARGIHHCEGSVRGPSGQFATMSSFEYVATQPRFAGFWRVPLSESSPSGNWIFESRVDGESAGQVEFQIVAATKPADQIQERPLPTAAEIYTHAVSASVEVDKLDSQGRLLRRSSGFFMKDGAILTSFRSLDGATGLRIRLAEGKEVTSPPIIAWNRRQDWAILASDAKTYPQLKMAESKTWNIGDHCYWLNVKSDGSRILSDGQIVGLKSPASWGDRIDISGVYDSAALGGPLLNDLGEVIGILGGALPESFLGGFASQSQADASEIAFASIGGIAVVATLVPRTLPAASATLQDLWDKGLMTPQVTNSQYILFGMLTQGEKIKGKKFAPGERDLKVRFQRGDASANALVHFANSESFKSIATIKLYDVDNHLVAVGKPEKVNVSRGELAERIWQLPLTNLLAGIYRVDIELGDGVAWRQYFELTE